MGGAGSLIQVYKAGETNTQTNYHTQSCTALQARAQQAKHRHLDKHTCACSASHALWPCSYQVKSFSFNGLAICQGHKHARTHTLTCTHKHPDTLKFQMMAICSATFHWDMCVHSNQESRLSGTQKPEQLLESTDKCVLEIFFFFPVLFMMQMSQLPAFRFPFNQGWIRPRYMEFLR